MGPVKVSSGKVSMLNQIDSLLGRAEELRFGLWIPDGGISTKELQDQLLPISSCLFQLSFVLFLPRSSLESPVNQFLRPAHETLRGEF